MQIDHTTLTLLLYFFSYFRIKSTWLYAIIGKTQHVMDVIE